jgi:predicted metal-binding membrane protein
MTTTHTHAVDEDETPRDTLSIFSARVTLFTIGLLVGLAGVAWWSTVRQANSMSDMVSGLGQVGARMPNDMTIPVFIGMWVAMMVAMMFPTIAPFVLAHRMVVKKRGGGELPSVAFVGGYLAVWSLIGVVPLIGFLAFRDLSADAGDSRWLPALAGGILVVAGTYQFTKWKALCLKHCRTPLSFLMTHDFGGGARSAFRAGLNHGAYCLGCCWALMAVLVVVGLMNLVWMAGIAIVFLLEKNWKHGVVLTKAVGAVLIALGLAVVVAPGILPDISGATGTVNDRVSNMDETGDPMGDQMKMGS